MELFLRICFFLFSFIIFWTMIGYPLFLKFLIKLYKQKEIKKDFSNIPTVTVMVVAHNEERVIGHKLANITGLNYPPDKIEFLITSDFSTDKTNDIVREFIVNNPNMKIRLHEVKSRKGKTNAQNEAQKLVTTEYLVMTDANSLLDQEAIRELMATFTSEEIVYVCGRLSYIDSGDSEVSSAESNYWNWDVASRDIEGRIQTITAGNGALYACRTKDYYHFEPIISHDTGMPLLFGLQKKRAIMNKDAKVYEKAGKVIKDEFMRKVRMNRIILKYILPDIHILNIFQHKWFTFFYIGHRTCRYLLWLSHLVVFLSTLFLSLTSMFFGILFFGQLLYFVSAIMIGFFKPKNMYLTFIYYYFITIVAQWFAVFNILTGKAKPFWEKAESTR